MKTILCIVCPNSCRLSIDERSKGKGISGNRCEKGIEYAKAEMSNPVRILTSTVRTSFPGIPVLPVRTAAEIPKSKINDIMNCIKNITIDRHLGIGDVVIKDVLGLGVNIIATSDILGEKYE